MSHESVATQGHISNDYLVISPGPVGTKSRNSDLPISPTSLAEIGTDPQKYLLTTQHIEVVTTEYSKNSRVLVDAVFFL
jgi:hypothetical protein